MAQDDKTEFDQYVDELEYKNRNQFIPGAYANANSWPKSLWMHQRGWRGKVIKFSAAITLLGILVAIIFNIIDLI
ncbi:hypothetical protein IPM19_00365 [bacterium]|nr:MAG: hypothetical protein IPM19_00365 [bacterium]